MKNYNYLLIIFIGFLTQQTFAQTKPRPLTEEDFYEIKTLSIPDNIKLEICSDVARSPLNPRKPCHISINLLHFVLEINTKIYQILNLDLQKNEKL